ncbi:mannose-6-phosphate isomerase [Cronobacter sakazakii]|nr:mannose-6-phosphate isomerase [Cronobacter sakazakii]
MLNYPLTLTTPLATHIFGGTRIKTQLGKAELPESRIAETWEVSDVDGMIATITNGEYAGMSLRELTTRYPDELVAPGWRGPHFPLLSKFIDGSGMLPVHLHANDDIAQRLENQPNGKTEAWHILWAAPGATCLVGIKTGVKKEAIREALLAGDYDRVMYRLPLKTGDTIYVPGGQLHSFGPDTLIYEIEQTSDIQQHAMPWNMEDGSPVPPDEQARNIDKLLEELRPELLTQPQRGLVLEECEAVQRLLCCAGPYFALERWRFDTCYDYHFSSVRIVTNIGAPVTIHTPGNAVMTLERAQSVILPAALGEAEFCGKGELLVSYVPDLAQEIVAPLRAAGYPQTAIDALGDISGRLR